MTEYLDYTGLQEYDANIKDYITAHSGSGGVTGVKGANESTYRTGNVNLTPANLKIGAITATRSTDQATTSSNAKVQLNSPTGGNSTLFATALSSYGIKCLVAGTVLVSGSIYVNQLTSGNGGVALRILKNSTLVGNEVVQAYTTSTLFATATCAPRVLTVAANDVIYLYVRSSTRGTIPANSAYLTVQYIG